MAAHKRSKHILADAKRQVEDCLRAGFFPPDIPCKGRGAHTEAAKRLADRYGIPESTAWKYINALGGEDAPDYTLFKPYQYSAKQHVISAAAPPDGQIHRICVIGDAHDSPALPDKSRFKWIGRWVSDVNPDHLIQIGDFCTLDSMTRHAHPGTKTFADLPSFREDLDSLKEALFYLETESGGWSGNRIITEGNHEYRAHKFEDSNPQMCGHVVSALHGAFTDLSWRIAPYGDIVYVGGVGFVHHPINATGRAYGGKTANQRAGSDTLTSLVHGHDHIRAVVPSPKIGPMGFVDLVSVGCALPYGYVEDYAKHGPSGWWWGVCEMSVCNGQILDLNYISMLELEKRYGGA